jgi:uncharacterized membrane protein
VFGVTALRNVPMNKRLDWRTDAQRAAHRRHDLWRWTALNHPRSTAFALMAAALLMAALYLTLNSKTPFARCGAPGAFID